MQILPDSPGDTSGETSSESSSSPQTPLDAGGHFVHAATMNQPIAHDSLYTQNYSLPAESGCLDHLSQAAGLSYTNGGVQESSRRDNELNHQSSGLTRPLGHRATANDPTFHPPPEQSSGSISTSPSSNNSSAAYSFTGNQRSSFHSPLSLPNLQQPFASAQPLPANSTTTYAFSGMPARTAEHTPSYLPSQQLPSQRIGYSSNIPVSPNGISRRQTYAAIPNLPGPGKLYQATPGADSDRYGYGSTIYSSLSSDSTRLLSSGLSMPAPSTAYSTQVATASDTMTPPFSEQQTFYEIYSGQSQTDLVKPHIDAKIEKGFFYSNDNCWTCYRRNYFAVQCSYQLTPHHSSLPHFLNKDGKNFMIQAMAMSLSARVDGTGGKAIELVQHTPKRDKGPQSQIQITKLCPAPPGGKLGHLPHAETHGHYGLMGGYGGPGTAHVAPPYFPMQSHPDPNAQQQDPSNAHHSNTTTPTAHQHTFERIQFKSATANNGKRRAQQQYYHLIVELHADIRDASSSRPNWVKVAERVSSQVVVRGRSPSHYSNEGPNSASNNRGTGGAAGGYGGMAGYGGYGGLPATGGSSMSRPFGGAYGLGGGYRGNQLAMDPMSSHTVSSSSSVAGTDGYMDHSSNMILTSQAAPDYMQPTPAVFSSAGSLPSIFGLPKIEDKFGYIPSRIPPPEVGVHTTVY